MYNLYQINHIKFKNIYHEVLAVLIHYGAQLSSDIFERRTSTGSEPFSLLISLDATVFVLPSGLILVETICPKLVQNHGSRVQRVHFRLTCVAKKRRCLSSRFFLTATALSPCPP